MHAFLFGDSHRPLFGAYHPAEGRVRAVGIVLCYPAGHEYIRVYRAFRNLADALSSRGFHVLRFDYYGAGESSGSGDEASIAEWQQNLDAAVDELKDTAQLDRVSLIGARLGASLAAFAATRRRDVDTLALWDPVVKGADYLAQLLDVQERWLRNRPRAKLPVGQTEASELIGFPLPSRLERELKELDLQSIGTVRARRVFAFATGDADPLEQLAARWQVPHEMHRFAGEGDWDRPQSVHLALFPANVMRAIVAAVADGTA
jgi:uncharacterized protein